MKNNLKELTQKQHDLAEASPFANLLISGDITPEAYQLYLHSQYENYKALEARVNLLPELRGVFRAEKIYADLKELEETYSLDPIKGDLPSVEAYKNHVSSLQSNKDLMAHLYVRHFGDMHGGQIIKKRVPGSGRMYEFEKRKYLIDNIRPLLDDSMYEEASRCFAFATLLFKELGEKFNMEMNQ